MLEPTASKHSSDAYSPAEIAALVEQGVARKAGLASPILVTLGNIADTSLCVSLIYWIVYLRPAKPGRV